MHILLIPSWYSTSINPIRGSFFLEQAVALSRAGHQVGMLVPPSRLRTLNGLQETIKYWRKSPLELSIYSENEIVIYRMPWWGWLGSISLRQRLDNTLHVFDQYCREIGNPDIVHGHSILYGGYLAVEIAQARQLSSVITEHFTGYISNQLQWGHAATVKSTLSKVDRLLAVSPRLADALRTFTKHPITIVSNVVDSELFIPAASALQKSPFVFTVIGTLSERKGQGNLLRAFANGFKGKEFLLHIVGDGAKRAEYESLCQQLGISEQVKFHGTLGRTAVRDILQQSHVLVSSSYIETFGVTIIEAMSCGLPIVATISGGPEYIVDAESGVLVEPGNITALSNALERVYTQYETYNPEGIRNKVVDNYSEAAVARQLTQIYESLVL